MEDRPMAMEKGFWKPIDPAKLKGSEDTAVKAYMKAVDGNHGDKDKLKAAFITALTPRFEKNGLIPEGKELRANYNKGIVFIGFAKKKALEYFDMGDP